MNVQANIKGMTGQPQARHQGIYDRVRINAVASFDRNAVMTVPAGKTCQVKNAIRCLAPNARPDKPNMSKNAFLVCQC